MNGNLVVRWIIFAKLATESGLTFLIRLAAALFPRAKLERVPA
jgi:hypothetical protein